MPLAGFLQENAASQLDESKQISFDQFEADPGLYAPRLAPASEALLWSLLQMAEDRARVPAGKITASEIDEPLRMLWLKATNDYFAKPSTRVSGMMGDLKHASVLRHRPGVWTSLRLEDDIGSGEFDTFVVRTGHLIDLKNVGSYMAKRILTEGVMRAAWGYGMQLNRYAELIENQDAVLIQYDEDGTVKRTPWREVLKGKAVEVRKLTLEVLPRDLTRQNIGAMEKLTGCPRIIEVVVPKLPAAEVRKAYEGKLQKKAQVIEDGHAPLCSPEQVWLSKGYPVRCAEWCAVRDLCVAYQREIGEPHYLDNVNSGGTE